MKITAVCGTGLGSSFMLEMNVKKVLKELGVTAEVTPYRFQLQLLKVIQISL